MNESRRTFLRQTGAGLAAGTLAYAATSTSTAQEDRTPIRVALIGCGGQGGAVASGMGGIVAVCDPDRNRLAAAAKKFDVDADKAVTDMRRIFDDASIDAVIIATPDHWHAPAAIVALDAGKHVYVEKPCCHNFREGQWLVAKAKETGLVVQHGTQSRSSRLIAGGIQLLREGIIGDVLVAKAWNVQRRENIGHAEPSPPPPELDYDLWVGPAEMVPYQSNRQHYTWHWWYNFGTGDMGNDGVHEIDYARWGLGVETLPTSVAAIGGKYFFDDDQQFPDTQTVAFEYPGDGSTGARRQLIFELRIWSPSYPYNVDNGAEFYGTRGRMLLTKRGKMEVYDERNRRLDDPRPQSPPDLHVANHHADFLDAIRTGRKPNAHIETGFLSAALCNLGNLSARLGRSLTLEPNEGSIVGDDEAQAMLGRTYREGGHWAVPENLG